MWPGVQQLATAGAATASELHDKFVQQGEGLDLGFGDIDTFFGGLEGIVGAPNPMIQTGMTRDHCEGEDADEPYVSSNYKMRTTSRVEWWFVFDPKEGLAKNEDRAAGWKHLAASFANLGGVTAYPVEDPSTISGSAKPREAVLLSAFESDMHSMSKRLRRLHQPKLLVEESIAGRLCTAASIKPVPCRIAKALPIGMHPSAA